MLLNIDLQQFSIKLDEFEQIDARSNPYSFSEFWKWKLVVENNEQHILDTEHKQETLHRLGNTLKIWQWHRPLRFDMCLRFLKKSLDKMSDAYDQVRNYSLLEFNEVPKEHLKLIWNELGCIKDKGILNSDGYYLVMPTTKPLLFLWGQTLAFDSVVRKNMPRFNIGGLMNIRWNFDTWIQIMARLQKDLSQQPKIVDFFRKTSMEKFRNDLNVPFGQFLDLYYWTDSSKSKNGVGTQILNQEGKMQEEKHLFGIFIVLLNKLKGRGKISAAQWRTYGEKWQKSPQRRDTLVQQLTFMLEQID